MPNFDRYHEATMEKKRYREARDKSWFCNEPIVIAGLTLHPTSDESVSMSHLKLRREGFQILFLIRTVIRFLTLQLIVQLVIGLSVVAVANYFDLSAQIHPALVLSAVGFPIAFSINASYQRREFALNSLASQRAACRSLLLQHKDWAQGQFKGLDSDFVEVTYKTILNLLREQHAYLIVGNEKLKHDVLRMLYKNFDTLSAQNDLCRVAGVPPPMITQPIHRVFIMIEMFEKLRIICDYRTPSAMRTYNTVFISVISILLAPYFSWLSHTYNATWVGYFAAGACAFMFGCLVKVQQMLENPFENAQDDINLDNTDTWVTTFMGPIAGDVQGASFNPTQRASSPLRAGKNKFSTFLGRENGVSHLTPLACSGGSEKFQSVSRGDHIYQSPGPSPTALGHGQEGEGGASESP